MRAFANVLLVMALIVGQGNALRTVYMCADGTECRTCAEAPCETVDPICDANTPSSAGECEQCCEAVSVSGHHHHDRSLSSSAPAFVAALPLPIATLELPARIGLAAVDRGRPWTHWPHAPPGEHSSRAPPFPSA